MDAPAPRVTSPTTVAPGATNAPAPREGEELAKGCRVRCLETVWCVCAVGVREVWDGRRNRKPAMGRRPGAPFRAPPSPPPPLPPPTRSPPHTHAAIVICHPAIPTLTCLWRRKAALQPRAHRVHRLPQAAGDRPHHAEQGGGGGRHVVWGKQGEEERVWAWDTCAREREVLQSDEFFFFISLSPK